MAQQARPLAHVATANLDYLKHPSEIHAFVASVFAGVVVTWGFAVYLANSFQAY